MKFGRIPISEAQGAVLAHSLSFSGLRVKKGRILSAEDVAALAGAGCETVVAARLEEGDVPEDQAAAVLAAAIGGANIRIGVGSSGRTNVFAETAGLLIYDRGRLDALNRIDEAIAIATLGRFVAVESGELVATVKIVTYGVARSSIDTALGLLGGGRLLRVAAFVPTDVGLLQTRAPGTRDSVLDKTHETCTARLAALGSRLTAERRCAHHEDEIAAALRALCDAGCELILIAGASATADRRDVVPLGIERVGGRIVHLGMPVEPGNLVLLGSIDERPVLCMPGSARSPTRSGIDWILERLLARLEVTGDDIMAMGAGGLLKRMTRSLGTAG